MKARQKFLILADDLSGAADCAVSAASFGLDSLVSLAAASDLPDVDVLSIDVNSRYEDARLAAAHQLSAYENVRSLIAVDQHLFLYKKIDSTLRGNIASEMLALKSAGVAIVAPAYIPAKRTTKQGKVYVNDIPLESTEIWSQEPMQGSSSIVERLSVSGLRTTCVNLSTVRSDLSKELKNLVASSQWDAIVCDAECEADLQNIALASVALPVYWVGSAGLIAHLPAAAEMQRSSQEKDVAVRGSIVAVIGSMSSVSKNQAAELKNHEDIRTFDISLGTLLNRDGSEELRRISIDIGACIREGRDVLILIGDELRADLFNGPAITNSIANLLKPYQSHIGALIATGGETARGLLSAFGISALEVIKEIEPGIPLQKVCDAKAMPVITKAGAFGTSKSLLNGYLYLSIIKKKLPNLNKGKAMYLPVIAITMGDAAGVGPETIMKSLAVSSLYERCRPLVIGDAKRLEKAGNLLGLSLQVHVIGSPAQALYRPGTVDCIDLNLIPEDLPFGQLSAIAGDAAYQYIAKAVEIVRANQADAICTAPLNKEALHAGGHIYPGHTELLAKLTETPEVSMMLVAPKLRVIHVTTHIGLLDAIRKIEPKLVERTIRRGYETLIKAGIQAPRIGVCGINPHAGENGLFGYGEEEEKIIPAVKACQATGMIVEGPLPADTLFFRAGRGDFDLVVAMYHDQGHGPVKVLGIEAGVNITVGLPVIRTSVDHGTAFDIAGKGLVDERSMLEAMRQAIDLAARKDADVEQLAPAMPAHA